MAGKSSSAKLTKKVIDAVDVSRGRQYLWDTELRGFGIVIGADAKTYFVRYRPRGLGRAGKKRFFKLGRHGDLTAEQAREQAKAVLGDIAKGVDPAVEHKIARREASEAAAPLAVQALGEMFLAQHVETKRSKSTYSMYELLLRRYLYPKLGKRPVRELTRNDLADLHLAMRKRKPSANRLLTVTSSMYSFAAKRDLVPEGYNPARGIERYPEEGRERYLTTDELSRLGATLIEAETIGLPWEIDWDNPNSKHTPKFRNDQRELVDGHAVAAIRLLLLTGARLREILHLEWRFVDLDRGLLFLPKSKTGKKTIFLCTAAIEVLKALAGAERQSQSKALFVIHGKTDQEPRADLKRPWRAVQRHAGLEGVRIHDLRHTFASIGAGASLGLPVVGKLLGHAEPQTTARYAHLDADPLRRAADIIGDRLVTAMAPKAKPVEAPTNDDTPAAA